MRYVWQKNYIAEGGIGSCQGGSEKGALGGQKAFGINQ